MPSSLLVFILFAVLLSLHLHQYIKILTCVCLSVLDGSAWDVRGAGLDYSDAQPSYFRTRRRMFENIGAGHGLESSKRNRTQVESSSAQRAVRRRITHGRRTRGK